MARQKSTKSTYLKQNTQMEKLCLTQFSTKIYFNRNLAASDVFQMFAQSIQFYICFCYYVENNRYWKKLIHQIVRK